MKILFLAFAIIFTTQCATIFNSGSQSFIAKASGDREGVMVEITTPDGSYRSKLPTTVITTPSSFSSTKINVVDNCYQYTNLKVKKSITPSFWSNILLGGLIGMTIDYFDGYMWKMEKMAIVPVTPNGRC
jgi:hypothetical protein